MTALAIVAAALGFTILVQAAMIRSLIANNRSLIRALIARNSHEVVVLDQSAARAESQKPTLLWPFTPREPASHYEDDDEIIPLGLSG